MLVNEGRILIKKLNNGNYQVYKKYYENDGEGMVKVPSIIDGIYNTEAKIELKTLFEIEEGRDNVFYTVKPTKLLKYLLRPFSTGNEIVMDFFSGAASTAQAIIEMNIEDNGKRKFVMVQLPEKTINPDYSTIAEIGKERIRRVIKSIETKISEESNNTPLLQNEQPPLDLGFKVFKYSRSNYKQWKPLQNENAEGLTPLFDNLSDPLIQDWKKEDLLSEILLLEGFPLTSNVIYLEELLKNHVYRVSAPDWCAHDLFVCLDETIQPGTIDLLKMEKEDIFICLDSALSDELKARLQDKFNVHVI